MIVTNLTPAGFTYLAKLYEQAIDQKLDVGQIHSYLIRKGVAVTRSEVVHQLDHVFSYHGYAAANPAKPAMTYEEFDAQMRKPARRLPSRSKELVNGETGV